MQEVLEPKVASSVLSADQPIVEKIPDPNEAKIPVETNIPPIQEETKKGKFNNHELGARLYEYHERTPWELPTPKQKLRQPKAKYP